jgi:molybdopterin-guanine dinucleotide biosynthesis protein A
MGRPKGQLAHPEGGTLIAAALRRLGPWARVRVVAGRGPGEAVPASVPWLGDPPGLHGPLAGLAAAVRDFPAAYYLVLAVDMPAARPDLLVRTARRYPGRTVVGQTPDGAWQPLAGLYPAAHARRALALLRRGERRARVWAACGPRPPIPVRGPWWANINTPADAERFLAGPGGSP